MQRLAGKTAIVSGAARGIGAAIARRFAQEGAAIVAADLIVADLDALRADICGHVPGAVVLPCALDVRDNDGWRRAADLAVGHAGRIDILVNNAGIMRRGTIETASDEEWREVLDINLSGAWRGMKTVVPAMKAQGGGAIVNISSIAGLVGTWGNAAYQASKAGLAMLSKNGAVTFGKYGIRCNSIYPGPVETAMLDSIIRSDKVREAHVAATQLRRLGRPEEIAHAVLFLASDEAGFITGADLAVDGGFTAA